MRSTRQVVRKKQNNIPKEDITNSCDEVRSVLVYFRTLSAARLQGELRVVIIVGFVIHTGQAAQDIAHLHNSINVFTIAKIKPSNKNKNKKTMEIEKNPKININENRLAGRDEQ